MVFLFPTNQSDLSPLKLILITLSCIRNLSRTANVDWIVKLSMGSSGAKIRSVWLHGGMSLQPRCGVSVILFQVCEKRELSTSFFLHTFIISLELYSKVSSTKEGLSSFLASTQCRTPPTAGTFIAGHQTINLNEQSRLFSHTYKTYIYSIHMLG